MGGWNPTDNPVRHFTPFSIVLLSSHCMWMWLKHIVYCAGTGAVDGLLRMKTGTVPPTFTGMEVGIIGYVRIMPIGSVRRHLYIHLNSVMKLQLNILLCQVKE